MATINEGEFADFQAVLCGEGIDLVIVSISLVEQVYVDRPKGHGYDLRYPQKIVGDLAVGNGMPWLNLMPQFREYARDSDQRLYDADHWNAEGHQWLGK